MKTPCSLLVFQLTSFRLMKISIVGATHLGSSLSLNSFTRLDRCVSVYDKAYGGSALQVDSSVNFWSALSVRSCGCLGSSLSVWQLWCSAFVDLLDCACNSSPELALGRRSRGYQRRSQRERPHSCPESAVSVVLSFVWGRTSLS